MDFSLDTNNGLVAESARDFANQFIRPNVMKWDESQFFPKELFKKAGEFGFMGILVPERLGGSGLGYQEYVTIIEEISKVDPTDRPIDTRTRSTGRFLKEFMNWFCFSLNNFISLKIFRKGRKIQTNRCKIQF